MKMLDWVEELDNQIKLNRRKILEGNGKISHNQAIEKAEKEFDLYRKREMRALESDFDIMIKTMNNQNVYYRVTYNEICNNILYKDEYQIVIEASEK